MKGTPVLDFSMEDTLGKEVRLSDYKGKVVLIDMWFSGCGACVLTSEAMPEVEKVFKDNPDVILLNVCVDKQKDQWLHSIRKDTCLQSQYPYAGKHYSGNGSKYLYTRGRGTDDPFIEKYVTLGYPTLMLIDRHGNLFSTSPARPHKGHVELISSEINQALAE